MGDDGEAARAGFAEAAAIPWPRPRSPCLADAVAQGGAVIAACCCGAQGVVDVRGWLAQGLGQLRLSCLEGRMRCVCGARQVQLIAGENPVAGARCSAIYVFR